MEKDMEKDYYKRTINIMGLTIIITFFITGFLLWFFVGGASLLFAIGIASGYALGGLIGWILVRPRILRKIKKRIQKKQAALNEEK
ncbi:hypothetical protein ES703_83346 [subsurface metagenome]